MPDKFSILILAGSLQEYLDDELLPTVTMGGLSWDEATKLCGFAFRQGYTCVVRQDGGENE